MNTIQKSKKRNSYIEEIKQVIRKARFNVVMSVNAEMLKAYWLIGKRIIEEEQKGKKEQNMEKILLIISVKN